MKPQVNEDDVSPPPSAFSRNVPDADGADLAFTATRRAAKTAEYVEIKEEEPTDDEDGSGSPPPPQDSDVTSSPRSQTPPPIVSAGNTSAFNNAARGADDDELYESSVPPRLVRGESVRTDSYQMYGGLGERQVSTSGGARSPTRGLQEASRLAGALSKRKAPCEIEAADDEVEDAELELMEIQAKKR